MTMDVDTLVIGGGPTGLAVAYALQGNTLILERQATVGGLCRSILHDGGVFDIGGHSFHTPHPEVRDLVESLVEGGLYHQRRDARIWFRGTLIPYPFQKYFDQLPHPDVVRECRDGLEAANGRAAAANNFEEFIVAKFGRGIADHFMLPYNRKLWARDIGAISCEWTSERVAAPKGENERFATKGGERKPLQSDTCVGYPRFGGFEEIYKAFVSRVPAVELNADVVAIDPRTRTAITADGRRYRWRSLVSTAPLPELVRIIRETPSEITELADRLEFMSLRVELILAGRRLDTPIQRIYVSDPEIPPHKIAFNHNSSEQLRGRACHAIMAEVSISREKTVDTARIVPATTELLSDLGVLDGSKGVAWTGHVDVKYGYPVYTHERPALLEGIKEWLAGHDIYPAGRFGDWEYVNSDKCVMKGLALGRELRERYHTAAGSQEPVVQSSGAERPDDRKIAVRPRRAIVLVAGRGRRLKSLTDRRPKCMVELAGEPILGRSLRTLSDCGFSEVVLVVGYRQEQIREFAGDVFAGMNIRYVENARHAETNTAYSLWLARDHLDEDVLLLEGDIVLDSQTVRAVLAAADGQSVWAGVPISEGRDEGILLAAGDAGRLQNVSLVREPEQRSPALNYKCAGLQLLTRACARSLAERLDGPVANGNVKLFADLVLASVLPETPIRLCSLDGCRWAEIDDPEDLLEAEEVFGGNAVHETAM